MEPLVVKRNTKGTQKKPVKIIIGTKVAKKAAERNKLRRRIRSIVNNVDIQDNDITIITKPGALSLSFYKLKELIESKIN